MKQIIPFQKELLFKTKINDITSISLEHNITYKDDNILSGVFLITGDYKMTEGSISREKFDFEIPFDISLNENYNIDTLKLDIDNFYYEVINNEILKVNIDVYIIGEKLDKEESVEEDIIKENELREDKENDFENGVSVKYEEIDKVDSLNDDVTDNNIFNNIDSNDTYITYYVYIVKEDDSLDKILDKFNVTREELEKYNDLSNIHEKAKLIIPSNNE